MPSKSVQTARAPPLPANPLGIIRHSALWRLCRTRHKRHSFAVHRLLLWYEHDEDLSNKLPALAAYMGHRNLSGTQRYLHLTVELQVALGERINAQYGEVIPKRYTP